MTELLVCALLELLELLDSIIESVEGQQRGAGRVFGCADQPQQLEYAERAVAIVTLIDQRARGNRNSVSDLNQSNGQ